VIAPFEVLPASTRRLRARHWSLDVAAAKTTDEDPAGVTSHF
jgi:hypothetical protein